ncbi:hypothetical protein [Paenibacillus sp. DYY-L-2]|uniref:hypothetical protein n=1 Tax=Paenibacillus sp. DYY-L-2 TaxID=3447013 RepID=UPI003F50B69E
MDNYDSELTRRYLLNSNSRGNLEEVFGEHEMMESALGEDLSDERDGSDENLTWKYFAQSYE